MTLPVRVLLVRTVTLLVAVTAGIALLGVVGAARADGADGARGGVAGSSSPVAAVHVHAQAYEGPRGTILAGLRGRCAPGYRVDELRLDFVQGEVTTPSVLGQPFPCDQRWHELRVSSLEAFQPGPAALTATVTVVRTGSGDRAQVADARAIYVRPAAQVLLARVAHLGADGALTVPAQARCDAPWVLQDLLASATQGDGVGAPSGYALADLVCDGRLHPVTFTITSVSAPYVRGWVRLDASLTLLDPDSFDPVTQATATRTAWVR
ncbi:hypothetical protein [Nocardioides sp.]|uniref:hypothetical protein n=1 Tax=Nocardioides sp. TaxID=35761 RepID=UPI003782D9F0